MFLSLKGPVALEAASGTAREVLLLDQRGRPAFKGLRVFRLEPNVGLFMVVGRWPLDNLIWGASLIDTRHGEAFAVEWPRPHIAPGIYPTGAEALLAAKCAAEWDTWRTHLPSDWERAAARRTWEWFHEWVSRRPNRPRPTPQEVVTAMRQELEGNARLWLDNLPLSYVRNLMEHLTKCRYDPPSRYPALGRALDAVGWPRGEAIPGERPLTMAQQRAHRAKKKAKKKVRAAAPRRPPQDPAPQERRFGFCKRCKVCLAYDVASGCCTVCARPLVHLNPESLASTQIRALLQYADERIREGDVEEGKAALSRAYMFVTLARKFKPSELERRRIDKLTTEIEEKWATHATPADNPRRRRRPKRRKRNPQGRLIDSPDFSRQLFVPQEKWHGMPRVRLVRGGMLNKPRGALWTSTLAGDDTSDWNEWLTSEQPNWRTKQGVVIEVGPEATVAHLPTAQAVDAFLRDYGTTLEDDPLTTMVFGGRVIDWPRVARDFDGVHVEWDALGHSALMGWDVESTAWLNSDHLTEVAFVDLAGIDPPADNPGLRRFKDPGEATRHADRAAKRSDTPQYVYALSSNPKFAVLPEGHPVQHGIEQGNLDMGSARLIHTAVPAPALNPRRKRRKKKAKSTREDRRARLRRLLRI